MSETPAQGSGFDLTELVNRLRAAGFRIDARRVLTAAELLVEYAVRGVDVTSDLAGIATHLAPIFCSSPEEQTLFASVVRSFGTPGEPSVDTEMGRPEPFQAWRRARWILPLTVAAVVSLVLGVAVFHGGKDGPVTTTTRDAGPDEAAGDTRPPAPDGGVIDQAPAPKTLAGYTVREVAG